MRQIQKAFFVSLFLTVFTATHVFAHALWVEKNQKGDLTARFGEYADGLREKSGGKLDEIAHLEGWAPTEEGQKALTPTKVDDGFALGVSQGGVAVQDVKLPVKDMTKYKLGIAKPHLYARFSSAVEAAKPQMRLDVLHTAAAEAQVFFDNAPLAKEKAVLIAPNGWSKELKTDEQGKLNLDLPWSGLCVVEVTHVLDKPGSYEGKEYQVERHRATLSLEKE